MKKLTTVFLVIAAVAFTSCSDTSLEENEEILQFDSTSIDKEDYEVPPNGLTTEKPNTLSTSTIDKEDYEVPDNG
ncbi:hypothetical protein ACE939_00695 [Aquimarina sp. W85]|uniref:hypothetical protein n=1 Tax=Aquimarina rhodophyticola TaxID=3342246 RepID=UPI00367280E7